MYTANQTPITMTYCDWDYVVRHNVTVGSDYLFLYQYFSSALPSPGGRQRIQTDHLL